MNNQELKEKNINNLGKEEEEDQLKKGFSPSPQNVQKENLNETFPDLEQTLINSMKLEMSRVKENLSQSQSKVNELFQENNRLKLLQLEISKKLSVKEDIINSNKVEINRLQSKNNILESENESKKNNIQDLNYKIIELSQKIESLESINKITQKIKNKEPENIEKDYLLELNQLYNKINEIEIKNAKLNFDNKILENKIKFEKNDKNNEIEMLQILHKKKIENLEKNIVNLNNTIKDLINDNKKEPKEINYNQIQNDVYQNFSELEQKLRKYDNDNFLFKKENQKLKNENEELKIILNGKENIINKLQSNIDKIENDFKIKISELNSNFKSQINNMNNNIIENNNNINNNENIENLVNDNKRLIEENEVLKNNYEQMTLDINEANELFVNKQKEYENIINYQNEKLKEYKFKISLLKIKINELHREISSLKNNRGIDNNQLSFISQNNNNIGNNQFKMEQKKLVSHTPKIRPKRKDIPFDLNLEKNDNNNEIENNNDIFGDIKISEVPKLTENQQRLDSNIDQQDLKNIQEYKNILNKIDEQLNKYN